MTIIPPPLPPDWTQFLNGDGIFSESPSLNYVPGSLLPSYPISPPPMPPVGSLVNQQLTVPGSQITNQGGDLSQGRYSRTTYDPGEPDLYDLQAHRYLNSRGESSYTRDDGILVIPVMGASGTAPVTVRVHAPIGFRTYSFEHVKDGSPPLVPAMADTASGDVFLGSAISFPTPTQTSKDDLRFGQRGAYTFLQAEVRDSLSVFPIDRHPMPTMIDSLGLDRLFDLDVQNGLDGRVEPVGVLDERWQANGVDAKVLTSYGIIK